MSYLSRIFILIGLISSNSLFAKVVGAGDFRNIFIQSLEEQSQKDNSDKLIYMPIKAMDEVPQVTDAEEFIKRLNDNYSNLKAQDLFQSGSQQVVQKFSNNFADSVKKQPLTIVIVPGIFSEFIATRAFEEVFKNKNSTYRKEFEDAYKQSAPNSFLDSYTSLDKVSLKDNKLPSFPAPITEFFSVSNIGNDVKILILKSKLLSLESVGDIDEKASMYNRRLDTFFKLMGTPKNIAFLGYSRGTTVSLEMLSQLKGSTYKWAKNVKSMVSLGGVTYGSDTADLTECLDPTDASANSNCASLYLVKKLAKELEYVGQTDGQNRFVSASVAMRNFNVINRNTQRWFSFFREMAKYNVSFEGLEIPEKVSLSDIPTIFSNLSKAIGDQFSGVTNGDFSSTSELVTSIAFRNFEMNKYFSGYDLNIKKIKLLVAEIVIGATQLATSQRLKWWSENEIPTEGIRYYSLAGTMAHAQSDTSGLALGRNKYAYNTASTDFGILEGGYNQYVVDTGFELNDSQVAVHKVRFWPELNSLLNPYYKTHKMKTTFLGVLGVHHWGLTLEVANKMRQPTFNPFPRVSLLKSLATAIAHDIEVSK